MLITLIRTDGYACKTQLTLYILEMHKITICIYGKLIL